VAQGVPGRLRPRIFLTFGTTRVVVRQPYTPAVFTPGEIPGTHFQRLSRPHGTWFCRWEPRKKSPVTPPGIDPGTSRLVVQCLNHYATPGWIKNRYIRSVCLCLSVNITFKKETENGTTSPKNMTPAVWAHIYWGRSLELSYIGSVCLYASLLHLFFSISVFILSVGTITCSPVRQSVRTVHSMPLMCALNHKFEVSIFPSLKVYYVNIFSILMIIASVLLSASLSCPFFRQSACYPPSLPMFIVFIYLFVCPYICLERWNAQDEFSVFSYRSDSLTTCPVHYELFLFEFGRSLFQISDWKPFISDLLSRKYIVVNWQFWCSDIYYYYYYYYFVVVVVPLVQVLLLFISLLRILRS